MSAPFVPVRLIMERPVSLVGKLDEWLARGCVMRPCEIAIEDGFSRCRRTTVMAVEVAPTAHPFGVSYALHLLHALNDRLTGEGAEHREVLYERMH